ncbi:MAG: hypothetical protein C4547_02150 [Phycisphaerales bacterium]|nr:MAG: hypothetical protein C4547_02150 [Phycisphaerales bacterium]
MISSLITVALVLAEPRATAVATRAKSVVIAAAPGVHTVEGRQRGDIFDGGPRLFAQAGGSERAAHATVACRTSEGNVVYASGVGLPPPGRHPAQARLMARRAAEVVAVRNLARRLHLPSGAVLPPFRRVSTAEIPRGQPASRPPCAGM